jgi:hypothetical protein
MVNDNDGFGETRILRFNDEGELQWIPSQLRERDRPRGPVPLSYSQALGH